MGLFDKIKKAFAGEDSNKKSTSKSSKRNAIAEETKPKAPAKPACEHGECVVCAANSIDKELFFTCDPSVECSKKSKYKIGDLWDDKLLPTIKAYSSYVNCRGGWDERCKAERKVGNTIIKTYVPALKNYDFTTFVGESCKFVGVTKQNALLVYLVNLHNRGFEFKEDKIDTYIAVAKIIKQEGHRINIDKADWLYNPSLYETDRLSYVVGAFITFSDKKWVAKHLLDTSVVDLAEFYNEDGTIKEAGNQGVDGDTIYNIIEQWCNGNENEEVFAEEKRKEEEEKEQRRRLKICENCLLSLDCKTKGMLANCPAYAPK